MLLQPWSFWFLLIRNDGRHCVPEQIFRPVCRLPTQPPKNDRPFDALHHLFDEVWSRMVEFFFKNGCDVAGVFPDEVIDEYVRAYAQPGALRAGFNFYRALRKDVADNRALFDSGFRLPMPTLGLGGGGTRGRGNIVVASLRRVADQVEGGSVPDCGHFIPEEKPAELAAQLREFLNRAPTAKVPAGNVAVKKSLSRKTPANSTAAAKSRRAPPRVRH